MIRAARAARSVRAVGCYFHSEKHRGIAVWSSDLDSDSRRRALVLETQRLILIGSRASLCGSGSDAEDASAYEISRWRRKADQVPC